RANYLASLAIFAIVAGIVAWNVVGAPEQPRRDPGVDAASLAETFARAARDDPIAEYKVSQIYARGTGIAGNKKEAQAWLERAAQHGNPEAQYELGNALREGLGEARCQARIAPPGCRAGLRAPAMPAPPSCCLQYRCRERRSARLCILRSDRRAPRARMSRQGLLHLLRDRGEVVPGRRPHSRRRSPLRLQISRGSRDSWR